MVPMSVEEIAKAVDGRLIGDAGSESRATNTVSDSRQAGPGSVFVAIRGERVDGHDFVAKTAEQGATVAIVDHEVKSDGLPQIVVKDTVDALGELARYNIVRRRELDGDFDIIGLTGSVGKTTTKDLLSSLLATVGPTVAPVGSFNNEIGLPLTALRVDEHTRFFVAEMGASHIGEIARLTRIAPPNTAIVLKVGVAHLGEFGSRERIAQAKSEIVQGLLPGGTAVLNADDEHVVPMAGLANGDVLWFGLGSSQEPEVRAIDVTADRSDHAEFTLVDADGNHTPVHLGIPGRHNVMNALAAATVAIRYGMAPETVARILASQHTISPHRMALSTVNREGTSFTLIDGTQMTARIRSAWRCWVPCWNSAPMRRHCTPLSARMRPNWASTRSSRSVPPKTNISMHWHRLWRTVPARANPRRWIAYTTSMRPNSWSSTWLATIPTLWYCSRDRTRQA